MKSIILAIATLCFLSAAGAAHAQANWSEGIVIDDPDYYARSHAARVATERMEPLRQVLRQFTNGAELDVQNEAALVTYERYLDGRTADQVIELEDATLGGAVRRIYYLHTFNGRYLFTRYDFIRDGERWRVTGVSFGSSWTTVATQSSPGWVLSQ